MAVVIIVPGIGGNELYTADTGIVGSRHLHVWLHYAALIAGGWRLLELDGSGQLPAIPFLAPLQPAGPLEDYYGTLRRGLEAAGYETTSVALDWRQQLWLDGERLRDRVRELAHKAPVHIVAHSRGGLVTRRALALLKGQGGIEHVGRCISLGTPHYGAWSAAGMIAGWEHTIDLLRLLLGGAALATVPALLLTSVLTVVNSWPAPYELLPAPNAPGLQSFELAAAYGPEHYTSHGLPVRPAWLSAARSRWMTAEPVPPEIAWVSVVGNGIPTPVSLLNPNRMDRADSWLVGPFGDGVVPAAWAQVPQQPVVMTPTGHSAMTYDPRVLQVILRHLGAGISANETLPGTPLDWGCLG